MMDVVSAPIIVFILMVSTTAVQSQITKGPVNALKKVGQSVTLECVTSRRNCDDVEWSKMEGAQSAKKVYTNGIILNGFPGERYSVSSTGDCNLTIKQLKINDSGRFSCVLTVNGREETRGSILVVINVTEACQSNVTSNALNQNDSYSFSTSINIPAKSVEPSDVTLSFQTEADDETNTPDTSQPLIVRATLTGIARKKNRPITHVCRASFPPSTTAGFDSSTGELQVCNTQQLIVSYPVEDIAVSPSTGPYCKGATVRCKADGHPDPAVKWTHLKSGKVVADGDTLVINGEVGDQYTCTASNTVNGKPTSLNITITVTVVSSHEPVSASAITFTVVSPPEQPDPGCGPGCIVGCVVAVFVSMVALLVCFCVPGCPLFKLLNSRTDKKDEKRTNGNEKDPEKSRINGDNLQTPQYEPLNELLPHDSEEMKTPTEVDVIGQSLSNTATNENMRE